MGVQIAKTDIFDKQIGVNMKNKPAFMCDYFGKGEVSDASRMTLRDYFAAKASEDDINEHVWKGHTEDFVTTDGYGNKTVIKRQAMWTREQAKYRYADVMLKARGE
jgi:hypothetical protein